MAGPTSSVRGGHRGKESPITRSELHQFGNSFVEAMERMLDERLSTPRHRALQRHSPTNSHGGLFGHSRRHREGAHEILKNDLKRRQRESEKHFRVTHKHIEREFPQPKKTPQPQNTQKPGKEGLVMMARRGDSKELSEPIVKMSEKEEDSCEELFNTNIITPSSSFVSFVMQVHEKNQEVNYDQPPRFDEEDQVIAMDSDAEISLSDKRHNVQIDGNTNSEASPSCDASLVAFEGASALDSFATIAAPMPLKNMTKYDTYKYVVPLDTEVIVHQNPCEIESHITKLKESEYKRELCDSTLHDIESTTNESVRDTPLKNREIECKTCEDIFETNTLISTFRVVFSHVQVCNGNEEKMAAHDSSILVVRDEKVSIQPNQFFASQNMNHDERSGNISEMSCMVVGPPQIHEGNENNSDLDLQSLVVSNSDKAHVSNEIDHDSCADFVVSHDHTFAEIFQVDKQCSVIYDFFYALMWFIYIILCTHISDTIHVNKFDNKEMNTHDNNVSAIEHNQNLCADLTGSHVETSNEFYFDKSLCALNDPSNTSYTDMLHLVRLVTCTALIARIYLTDCLCMLDMPILIDKILEKIFVMTSLSDLTTAHSCKFTFILIGDHVVNIFQVHAICVTYDMLAGLESKPLSEKHIDKFLEIQLSLDACDFKQLMLPSCAFHPWKERKHVQSMDHAHKSFSPTCRSIKVDRYASKLMNHLSHNNFWNTMNAQHRFDEKFDKYIIESCNENVKNASSTSLGIFDLAKMKYDNMNQLIGLQEILVLPTSKLFVVFPRVREYFIHGKANIVKLNHNGASKQNKEKDYWNHDVHPPSALSRLFSGKQKSRTTFLQGREDDMTMPRHSTFTICSKNPFEVKAKLDFKLFMFPPTRLLLGLYDYRLKHLAVLEDKDYVVVTVQVLCLAQLFGIQELESRTTPFQGREDDTPTRASSTTPTTLPTSTPTPTGPITCRRAKKIQQEVHALLCELKLNSNDNFVLPKSCMLILLRFTQEATPSSYMKNTTDQSADKGSKNGPVEEMAITFDSQKL
jgi:hypothetical protein